MTRLISPLFDGSQWKEVPGLSLTDLTYHRHVSLGIVRIAFDRPEVRNAFRPHTVDELHRVLDHARQWSDVGVVWITGNGPSPKDGGWAFCSGGDQRIRGQHGYQYQGEGGAPDPAKLGRLHILEVQRLIRFMPKVVICLVNGWAAGGGHSLHVVCDLTVAADNARFGQTGPKVGSFDGGFGASYLARIVGQKKAREIWFLCDQYDAQEALDMGLVNKVVPLEQLEATTIEWCRKIMAKSPLAIRMLKASFNAELDGQAGIQELAGNATLLYYMSAEAQEGKNAFIEKREPEWDKFPKFP